MVDLEAGDLQLEVLEERDQFERPRTDEALHLGAGDGHEVLDEPAHPVQLVLDDLDGLAERIGIVTPDGAQHLEVATGDRDRRAQLVGDGGHELGLAARGAFEPLQHRVELVGEDADLVVGVRHLDACVEPPQLGRSGCRGQACSGDSERHSAVVSSSEPMSRETAAEAATSPAAVSASARAGASGATIW